MVAIVSNDDRIVFQLLTQVAEKQFRVYAIAAVMLPPFFPVGGFVSGNLFPDTGVGRSGFYCFYRFQERGQGNSGIALNRVAGGVVGVENLRVDIQMNQAFRGIDAIASSGNFGESGADGQRQSTLAKALVAAGTA